MLFSILIPVYNTEKYLQQCLDSVLQQDFDDYEVILVNDGSTDKSLEICRKYERLNSHIKLYDKPNEGLLLTRRFSLKKASGDYILFLDSDDFWEPNVLQSLSNIIEKNPVDLILFRFRRVRDNGEVIYEDVDVFQDEMFFDESSKNILLQKVIESSRLNTLWSKCANRNIIDIEADYSCYKDRKGEDILQSIPLLKNAKTIFYINSVFVNYRLSVNGRGRNFKEKYIDDFEVVRKTVYDGLVSMNASEDIINSFYSYYLDSITGFLMSFASLKDTNFNSFKQKIKQVENYDLYKAALDRSSIYDYIKNKKTVKMIGKIRRKKYVGLYLFAKIRGGYGK